MNSKADKLKQLIEFECPRWDDLPDFGIYMDQVLPLINQKLEPLYFGQEKILTKSMVNNYVKNSIVEPPVKKHYNRNHLAFLIVVVILKRCFTLSEISELIQMQKQVKGSTYEIAFNKFSAYFEIYLHEVMHKGNLQGIQLTFSTKEEELMGDVIASAVLKTYAMYRMAYSFDEDEKSS